jgi:plastocyanin
MTRYLRPLSGMIFMLVGAAAMASAASAATIRVEVKGLAFTPAAVTAHIGDTIEWVNDDFIAHTATARNGAWDVMLAPHASGRTVAKTAGGVAYYCRYHPNMKGEVTITPR